MLKIIVTKLRHLLFHPIGKWISS